jgi:hypothetical protein
VAGSDNAVQCPRPAQEKRNVRGRKTRLSGHPRQRAENLCWQPSTRSSRSANATGVEFGRNAFQCRAAARPYFPNDKCQFRCPCVGVRGAGLHTGQAGRGNQPTTALAQELPTSGSGSIRGGTCAFDHLILCARRFCSRRPAFPGATHFVAHDRVKRPEPRPKVAPGSFEE